VKYHLYYETLKWDVYLKNFFRQDKNRFLRVLQEDFGTKNVFLTRSGRTGILLSLKAFGLTREDEVMVPRFMSACVLDAVNHMAVASLHLTERTKAVLFFHHWGYQQNYAKAQRVLSPRKLWIIEDCAHGVWGNSQGKGIGAFGHTAIFSLPKIFEISYAGALRVNETSLLDHVQKAMDQAISAKNWWESLRGEWEYLKFYNAGLERRETMDLQVDLLKWYATLLQYPQLATLRGLVPRDINELREVFHKNNRHFLSLLKKSRHNGFMLAGDQEDTMAPLCFPVLSDDEIFLNSIVSWLKVRRIFTGIYHFDVNRCMFEPNNKKCVPIPLHASLPDGLYADFIRDYKGRF